MLGEKTKGHFGPLAPALFRTFPPPIRAFQALSAVFDFFSAVADANRVDSLCKGFRVVGVFRGSLRTFPNPSEPFRTFPRYKLFSTGDNHAGLSRVTWTAAADSSADFRRLSGDFRRFRFFCPLTFGRNTVSALRTEDVNPTSRCSLA